MLVDLHSLLVTWYIFDFSDEFDKLVVKEKKG